MRISNSLHTEILKEINHQDRLDYIEGEGGESKDDEEEDNENEDTDDDET